MYTIVIFRTTISSRAREKIVQNLKSGPSFIWENLSGFPLIIFIFLIKNCKIEKLYPELSFIFLNKKNEFGVKKS